MSQSELPVDPKAVENLDEIDHVAAQEGKMMRRAFKSSRGVDVAETVYSVAGALTKRQRVGQTERKPVPVEFRDGAKLRLRRRKGGKSK